MCNQVLCLKNNVIFLIFKDDEKQLEIKTNYCLKMLENTSSFLTVACDFLISLVPFFISQLSKIK